MTSEPVKHIDENGNDVSEWMINAPATRYDEAGRITGGVSQSLAATRLEAASGGRILFGESGYDWLSGDTPSYVDLTGPGPIIRARPVIELAGAPERIAPGVEATFRDLPPCLVRFVGPISGSQQHPGGDLEIGWTVPGTYALTFDGFPHRLATHPIEVVAS